MKAWIQATRGVSLTAVLMPVAAVVASNDHPNVLRVLSAALGAACLLLGVNMANDVEDHTRGIDAPGSLGGSGVLQAGTLSAQSLQRAAYVLYAVGLLLGVPVLLAAPKEALVIGSVAAIGAVGYSGKPLGLKYRALGDVTVFALCGPVLSAGASLAAYGAVIPGALLLGVSCGLAAVAILHTNNMQDVKVDQAANALTVARVLGPVLSRIYLAALYGAALIAWLWVAPSWGVAAVGLVGFLPAMAMLLRVARAHDLLAPQFRMLRVQAALAHLAIGTAITLALILRGVLP